jgi:hypothetical protein
MGRRQRYLDVKDEAFLGTLNDDLDDLDRRLLIVERTTKKLDGVRVETTETELRHGLGRTPEDIHPVPRSDARVFQTKQATDKAVFLAANVACVVDVYVK